MVTSDNPAVIAPQGSGSFQAINLGTANLKTVFSGMTNTVLITVGYQFTFTGLTPFQSYNIQVAPAVTGPWSNIATLGASAAGVINFEDTVSRGPQAFYRAKLIPE